MDYSKGKCFTLYCDYAWGNCAHIRVTELIFNSQLSTFNYIVTLAYGTAS